MARKDTLLLTIACLAWRPPKFAPAEQVKVQVKDGLPGVGANVGDEAITLVQIKLVGQLLGNDKYVC